MWRFQLLFAFIVISVVAVIGRLFYWQVFVKDSLVVRAEQQHLFTTQVPAWRGEIFSADGAKLVTNRPAFLLYAWLPSLTEKKGETVKALAPLLLASEEATLTARQQQRTVQEKEKELSTLFAAKDLSWIPLERKVDQSVKKSIDELGLEGIGFERDTQRYYPEASMAAQLLGFVGANDLGQDTGYFGVEGYYNRDLTGKAGVIRQERDAKGRPILIGNYQVTKQENGRDLVLYLDRTIQFFVEQHLASGMAKYGAKAAQAVVIDPQTGGILAMAAFPSYDQLRFDQFDVAFYKNPVVADTYEPGSTFKVLVMAAGIQEGVVKPDTLCSVCGGPRNIGGFTIRTWNNKYQPNQTMTDVIVHSDNTGMTYVAEKLGLDKLYKYLDGFGFGRPTGVDLQEETSAPLRPKQEWHPIDVATVSFGQGIATTAMQMVNAVAAIANGGKLLEPHVVSKIVSDQREIVIKPKVVRQVIRADTAKLVTEMMVAAVEHGEAKWTKLPGYRIAGKTGTAQIPIEGHYDPQKTIASFVGFAPADDPRFVMLVRYTEPSSSPYGAETAAPTFFAIAKDILRYWHIPPSQ